MCLHFICNSMNLTRTCTICSQSSSYTNETHQERYKLVFFTLIEVWLMPRSCNKSLIVHSYYFSSSITYDVLGPCPAPSPPSVRHHLDHFWVHGWVWKNVFPRFLCKKQNINLQTHSAVNHRHIYEACQTVKGNPAVDTSGGREALVSFHEGHFSAGSCPAPDHL